MQRSCKKEKEKEKEAEEEESRCPAGRGEQIHQNDRYQRMCFVLCLSRLFSSGRDQYKKPSLTTRQKPQQNIKNHLVFSSSFF